MSEPVVVVAVNVVVVVVVEGVVVFDASTVGRT